MYVEETDFELQPSGEAEWAPVARAILSVTARQPGSVSCRILRSAKNPLSVLVIATWRDRGSADRARQSEEVRVVAQLLNKAKFYKGGTDQRKEFELLDMVWGRESKRFGAPGTFVNHIAFYVKPDKYEQKWRPYARNFVSVMARQPGLVAEEIFRSLDDRYSGIALRTFVGRENSLVGPEFQPTEEIKLATQPADDAQVYDRSRSSAASRYREDEVFEVTLGASALGDYDAFMDGLVPV